MRKLVKGTEKTLAGNLHGPGGGLEVLSLAAPLFISQACETVMLFTDRLFLAKLGPEQMAATMGGGLTSFMFVTFFAGLIGYSTAMVAQNLGASRSSRCAVVTTQSLIVALLAYPVVLSCMPLGNLIFTKTGISPEQMKYQVPYFEILMFGQITVLLRCSLGSFFNGIGKTRIIMLANIACMVCNVGLNYLLVFGKLGFPQLGIRGAAYGTVISGGVGLLILCFAYFSESNVRQYAVMRCFRFSKGLMKELLVLGYPAGLEQCLNLVGFTLMVTAFQSQGTVVASAVTIAFNWDLVSFIPLIGVNIAVTSLVGRYVGARVLQTAQRSVFSALKLALIYSVFLLIPFGFFTEHMVNLFRPLEVSSGFEQIQELAEFMVRFIAFYVIADAVLIVSSGALRGAGDTFWTMVISVSMNFMFALTAFLMFNVFGASPKVVWIMIITLFIIFGPLLFLRFRSGHWKKKLVFLNQVESEREIGVTAERVQ